MRQKILLLSILLGASLVACTQTVAPSSSKSEDEPPVSSEIPASSSGDSFSSITGVTEFNSGLNGGQGIATAIAIDRYMPTGTSFKETYSLKSGGTPTLRSSDESIFKIEKVEGMTSTYLLTFGHAGDALFTGYDAHGDMVYRKIIRVRKAYDKETLPTALVTKENFVSMKLLGDMAITFVSASPCDAVFSGSDDLDKGMNYTVRLGEGTYREEDALFYYPLETLSNDSDPQNNTELSALLISSTADMVMVYYKRGTGIAGQYEDGLLAWCFSSDTLWLHPEFGSGK